MGLKILQLGSKKLQYKILSLYCWCNATIVLLEYHFLFIHDPLIANKVYKYYQALSLLPVITLLLGARSMLRRYSRIRKPYLKLADTLISISATAQLLFVLWLCINGPSAFVYLNKGGIWEVNLHSVTPVFRMHTIFSLAGLGLFALITAGTAFYSYNLRHKSWFKIISCVSMVSVVTIAIVIYRFLSGQGSPILLAMAPAGIPYSIAQLWALTEFQLFEASRKTSYTAVIEGMVDWFFLTDTSFRILDLNNVARAGIGLQGRVAHTHFLNEVFEFRYSPNAPFNSFEELIATCQNKFYELRLSSKISGKEHQLLVRGSTITFPGYDAAYLFLMEDVTTARIFQMQRRQIEEARQKLQVMYDDIRFVMSMVSHDMRTPVATIVELAAMIRDEDETRLSPVQLNTLSHIHRLGSTSTDLIKHMLDFLRLGVMPPRSEPLLLNEIIQEIQTRLKIEIEATAASITYTDLPPIKGDARELQELLVNLLSNSIKYRRAEAAPVIKISAAKLQDGYLEISVTDNGAGVREKDIDHLFEPHFRPPGQIQEGSGLGLFIAKKIIEKNGGKILLHNNTGAPGITVRFTIRSGEYESDVAL